MAKNRLADLRDHLFETLEALKDPEKPMDVDRAHAIATVAREIIGAAKVEVQYLHVVRREDGDAKSEFMEPNGKPALAVPQPVKTLSTGKRLGVS